MANIFKPAVIIMDKLRYPQKFSALFVITLIPLLLLSYNMINDVNNEIDFIKDEIIGVQYLQASRLPMQHIQQHRGMTAAYLNGATQFKDRIMTTRQRVDQYLEQLQKLEDEFGEKLALTGSTRKLEKKWSNIKANSFQGHDSKSSLIFKERIKLLNKSNKWIVSYTMQNFTENIDYPGTEVKLIFTKNDNSNIN